MSRRSNKAIISLFSGALGLDLGLERAGFRIRVAVECNRFAVATIRRNRPDIRVIDKRLEEVTTEEILAEAKLAPGEAAVVTGGPSCQAFSTAGQRGSMGDPRGVMFREFLRVVSEAQPRYFVMENVRGVLSAAVKHRPLKERGPGFPALAPEEELGSAFALILRELGAVGYHTVFDVLNSANFGVPQVRERVLFIGSRDGEPITMPPPTHALAPSGSLAPWMTLREALRGLNESSPEYTKLPAGKAKYMKHIPEGGNWRDLPRALQAKALGGAFKSWGGRTGFFRRLTWKQPAPSLTTRPDSKATMLCHPEENRPLSVREYARIQQFPDTWDFEGGVPQQYKQVGNAVPVGLGSALGFALAKMMRRRRKYVRGNSGVTCANPDFAARAAKRPRTILNPQRMRLVKGAEAAREWLQGGSRQREAILETLPRVEAANSNPDESEEKIIAV